MGLADPHGDRLGQHEEFWHLREGVFDGMAKMVEDSMTSGEEVLDKAEKFMNKREKHKPVPVEVNSVDLVQGQGTGDSNLVNTLRPDTLSSTMTLEELTILLKNSRPT